MTRTREGPPRILHGLDAADRNVVMRASLNVDTPRKPLWMDALDTERSWLWEGFYMARANELDAFDLQYMREAMKASHADPALYDFEDLLHRAMGPVGLPATSGPPPSSARPGAT